MKAVKRLLRRLFKARGLGDVIKSGTKVIGIKQCSTCKRRQKWMNRKISFR